jgi:homoserine O-acetyltransferase
MFFRQWLPRLGLMFGCLLTSAGAMAADFPSPQEGSWEAKDFRFSTGEVLPSLRLNYTTVGDPSGEPVLVLHGTTGSAKSMLGTGFAGELFGPGQPLDASRYYIIIPDAIGTGKSSKPSDGLRTAFPRYNYDDMVLAQYRLLTEHLGVRHLRLVVGNSMGGMHTWIWAYQYPAFMDIAVPLASLPTEMSGRNWMMRKLLTEAIVRDPEWKNGQYDQQPRGFQLATAFFAVGTNGGNQGLFQSAPTREKADALVEKRLSGPVNGDANDHLYQWGASAAYNPAPHLARIQARLLAINSSDDERNPPELGVLEREMARVKNGASYWIPGSPTTTGHGTTMIAKLWKARLQELLASTPKRPS